MRRNLIRFLLLTMAWLGSVPLMGHAIGRSIDDRCWLFDAASNNHLWDEPRNSPQIKCPSFVRATIALAEQLRGQWLDSLTQQREQIRCQFQELANHWPAISWTPSSASTSVPPIDEYWAYYEACDTWSVSWGATLAEWRNPSHLSSQVPQRPLPQVSLIVLKPISGFHPQTELLLAFTQDSLVAVQSQVRDVWQTVQLFGYQCQYYRLRGESLVANWNDDLNSTAPQFVTFPIGSKREPTGASAPNFWQQSSEWWQRLRVPEVINAINDAWTEKTTSWLEQLGRCQQAMEWLHLQHVLQGL